MSERAHDLLLFGATGYTGRLVAEYLKERYGDGSLRWALAGRDRAKLERVKSELGLDVPILVGDAMDEGAMRSLAQTAKVIVTTVGPYAKYGSALVAACAAEGTDYCDLTGEVYWMRAMIDAHHETAKRTGARIVHTCGYDSIPSDIGTLALVEHARGLGLELAKVKHYAGESRGTASGGTVASMLVQAENMAKDRSILRVVGDPYALDPAPRTGGPDGSDQQTVRFDDALGMWTAPFFMAPVNTRVVRRTNALSGYRYGRDFRYEEVMSTGAGPKGLALATAVTAGLGAMLLSVGVAPLRKVLAERVLPKPGDGPSREARERGYFTSRFLGTPRGDASRALKLTIRGKRDPGYGATSRMLAECAVSLLRDDLPREGGVLTPALVMGMKLVPRLESVDVRFEYEG